MTILADFEKHHLHVRQIRDEISKVVVGQKTVIDLTLISILSGGHALLIGMPGLAKTLLVKTTGIALGLDTKRIQCTPDLMPSDILGSEVLEVATDGTRHFRFLKGPVFSQMLMADEINRASPRTQSALLQAMEERIVTIAGTTYTLPTPFHVLATQNPIEQAGTYSLPEAQLDRFLLQIDVGYPDARAEKDILLSNLETQVMRQENPNSIKALQDFVRLIPIGEKLTEIIVHLVRICRPGEEDSTETVRKTLEWGPSPRATQALTVAVRARALLHGRPAPTLDDVEALMVPALTHRMALTYSAQTQGLTKAAVIAHAFEQAQRRVPS